VTNYEVSKLVRHTIQPKGSIRRLSVAVILDHKTTYTKDADGKVKTTVQPRTQQELNSYRELVLAAVGFDQERGDVVTLESVPFYKETMPEEDRPPVAWHIKWQPYLLPGMKYGAFLLLFLLVYFILFKPIRKRVFQAIPLSAAGPALPAESTAQALPGAEQEGSAARALPSGTSGAAELPGAVAGEMPALMHASESGVPSLDLNAIDEQIEREFLKEAQMVDMDGRKYSILKSRLIEHAKRDPETISQLIRSWLQEKA
jgi:flagellar M-ring protein FliF